MAAYLRKVYIIAVNDNVDIYVKKSFILDGTVQGITKHLNFRADATDSHTPEFELYGLETTIESTSETTLSWMLSLDNFERWVIGAEKLSECYKPPSYSEDKLNHRSK